jgi:GntR family transcriptional regulator
LVSAGKLKPDDRLPTVRQLAIDLRVNPNTVARAYAQLAEDGVISTRQGRGTYVLETPLPVDQRRLRRERLMMLVDTFLSELDRLGYTPEELEKIWGERLASWQKLHSKG